MSWYSRLFCLLQNLRQVETCSSASGFYPELNRLHLAGNTPLIYFWEGREEGISTSLTSWGKKWTKSTSSELTRMHSLGFYEGVGGCRRAVYSSTFNQFPPRVNASVPLAWLQVSCVISTPFSGLSILCFLNGVRRKIQTNTQPVPSLFSIQMDWLDQWECREISFSSSVSSSASVASCRANQCRS